MGDVTRLLTDGPVLLVEDEALIAFEAEDLLRDLGAEEVQVCWSFDAAATAVDERIEAGRSNGGPGVAVFDLNLNGILSTPLIERFVAAGGRVVLATGYELEEDFVENLGAVHLVKPYDMRRMEKALEDLPPATVAVQTA